MELTIYDIIRGPVISSKAYQLNKKLKKLMVYIHKRATKHEVKNALEKLFNVKVDKVNTLRSGSKSRRIKQRIVVRPGRRKAIITLTKNSPSLNFFGQGGSSDVLAPEVSQRGSDA